MPSYLVAVLPVTITAAASLAAVCITQYQSKKLTFFQTYFTQKMEAYSAFWEAETRYEKTPTSENYLQFVKALHIATLFAPENVYHVILTFSADLIDGTSKTYSVEDVVAAMRKDLDQCRKLKFK